MSIEKIRTFLSVQDRVVRRIISQRHALAASRTEFTCEWFARPLKNFTRSSNNILLVTGGVGTGKSVLAGWTVERLQGAIERTSHDVISHTIGKSTQQPIVDFCP